MSDSVEIVATEIRNRRLAIHVREASMLSLRSSRCTLSILVLLCAAAFEKLRFLPRLYSLVFALSLSMMLSTWAGPFNVHLEGIMIGLWNTSPCDLFHNDSSLGDLG